MKKLTIIVIGIAVFIGINVCISKVFNRGVNDYSSTKAQTNKQIETPKAATMEPGCMVVLNTTKGIIDFVLFEKDCPVTTSRIKKLVSQDKYANVRFPRVEDLIIQTGEANIKMSALSLEAIDGLTNAKGTVGIAHKDGDDNSGTSALYILKDPMPGLDGEYTIIGRIIHGMDVVMKLSKNDYIKSAKLRSFTKKDNIAYKDLLKIEAERLTEN